MPRVEFTLTATLVINIEPGKDGYVSFLDLDEAIECERETFIDDSGLFLDAAYDNDDVKVEAKVLDDEQPGE